MAEQVAVVADRMADVARRPQLPRLPVGSLAAGRHRRDAPAADPPCGGSEARKPSPITFTTSPPPRAQRVGRRQVQRAGGGAGGDIAVGRGEGGEAHEVGHEQLQVDGLPATDLVGAVAALRR